jgi:hypothetical protein
MIRISLFIIVMIVAIGIHYYIFYYKPNHAKVSETLSNMRTVSLPKKRIDEIPEPKIEMDIIQNETNDYRPKINVLDTRHIMNKKYNNNIMRYDNTLNSQYPQNLQKLSLCTYTPSNDFVYQNDSPYEPSGSNQIMNEMSPKFLNDNLYQASFFTFSPEKNRIVYVDHPKQTLLR